MPRSSDLHCWVALQHFQGCHPQIIPEHSELLHVIGPDDPTLVIFGLASARLRTRSIINNTVILHVHGLALKRA